MAEAPSVQAPLSTGSPDAPSVVDAPPESSSSPSTLLTADPDQPPAETTVPEAEKAPEVVAPVIPEKYELTVPEGLTLAEPVLAEITPVLKELGVTAEGAQKLADAWGKAQLAQAEAMKPELEKAQAEAKAKADSDFSEWLQGEVTRNAEAVRKEWGPQFNENLRVSQRAIARFADADFKKILDTTGLGSHPSVVKAFFAIGQMIREDSPPPNGSAATRKPLEAVLYPSMASN